ncbi:MAG: 2-amino-4-hydroxy-6-hydroxymethyldihydropteridine diphosphokinase [Acidobacteriota bacterium]
MDIIRRTEHTALVALGSNLGEPSATLHRAAGRMHGILPGVRLAARSRIYHSAPHELARLEYPWPEVLRPAVQAGKFMRSGAESQGDSVRDERESGLRKPQTRHPETRQLDPSAGQTSRETAAAGPVPIRPATPWYANMAARLECAPDIAPEVLFEALMALEAELGRNRIMEKRWGPRIIDIDLLTFGRQIRSTPRLTLPHPRMALRAFVLLPLAEIAPEEVSPEIFEGLSFSASDTMIF